MGWDCVRLWGKRERSVTRVPWFAAPRGAASCVGSEGASDLQAACLRRVSCGTTRVRADRDGAKNEFPPARESEFLDTPSFFKYLRGYIDSRAGSFSTGPNDASMRQKLAFPS